MAAAAAAGVQEEEKCAGAGEEGKDEVAVCLFDDSPERFCSAVRAISELTGGDPEPDFPAPEVERFASMVTFLKEWKYFSYEPKVVGFNCEAGSEDGTRKITLAQFSSATVPQFKQPQDERNNTDSSDFILFAGGNVWALDWCPKSHDKTDSSISCEYLAVAAHPPGSTYHKIGMPLVGRGIIQIWCLLTCYEELEPKCPLDECNYSGHGGRQRKELDENYSLENGSDQPKVRGRPRKRPIATSNDLSEPVLKRPRGRPRKCLLPVAKGEQDRSKESNNQDVCLIDPLITSRVVPEELALSSPLPSIEFPGEPTPKKCRGRPRKKPVDPVDGCSFSIKLKEDRSTLPTSTALICAGPRQARPIGSPPKEKRGRGRPRKFAAPNNANHIPVPGVELRKGPTSLPISVACGNNHIDYTSCNANLSVVSADATLPVHSRPNAKCDEESVSRSRRGRAIKKPFWSALYWSMDSGAEEQNTAPMPTMLNGPVTSVENALPVGGSDVSATRNEICSISLFSCSPNENYERESSGNRGRGRPRKQMTSNKLNSSLAFGVESPKMLTMPSIFYEHEASIENAIPLGRSHCEVLANEPGSIGSSKCNIDERNVHLNVISDDALLPLNLSPNANCKEESNVRKSEGRPGKKSISTEYSGEVQRVETAPMPSKLSSHVASIENAIPLGISNCEVMASDLGSIGPMNESLDCKIIEGDDSSTTIKTSAGNGEKELSHQALLVNGKKTVSLIDEMDDRGPTACKEFGKYENMTTCSGNSNSSPIPKDIALPRVVLCLAHNGKVAWDVKWKPSPPVNQSEERCCLGYLAALLGDGSLEVWEVPSPNMVQKIYSTASIEDTDPRFLKLQPVFRCANVKCGNRQSIPLTVEWSPSPPHDMILAGCHDGTVALWRFTTNFPSQDSKPLMCFTADSAPIRALSWAPYESEESSNLFVTAGEDGLKFWDLRDPYRPLWELATRAILSLDWLKDPSCIVASLEDGTLKFLGLSRSACDVAVTGRPCTAGKNQGFSTYQLSEFVIWSLHISRSTGLAAYCGADGTAVHFKLTPRFLEKAPGRNRVPYFLCGSLSEKEKILQISSPLSSAPLPNVPALPKKGSKPCRDIYPVHDLDKEEQQSLANPGDDCTIGLQLSCALEGGRDATGTAGAIDQGDAERCNSGDDRCPKEFEFLPPKAVALNRLRWNMNKGSERWLCYGGAAGIIRCQKIPLKT